METQKFIRLNPENTRFFVIFASPEAGSLELAFESVLPA
jgi:hypothetical protein